MDGGERWVRTDEVEDVAASVRHALRSRLFTSDDAQAWKWVALALHSALQGACICHLVTTAIPIGAVSDRNAAEWIKYFEESRVNPNVKAPKTFLLSLPDLLKAVRKPQSAGDRSNTQGIRITDQELDWLCSFHEEVRNQFVHFEPKGWSLEISGIPELGRLIARVIDDILGIGWAFRHMDQPSQEALRANLLLLASSE